MSISIVYVLQKCYVADPCRSYNRRRRRVRSLGIGYLTLRHWVVAPARTTRRVFMVVVVIRVVVRRRGWHITVRHPDRHQGNGGANLQYRRLAPRIGGRLKQGRTEPGAQFPRRRTHPIQSRSTRG